MEKTFVGKRILITGASKGLGAVCFQEFASRGARLVISGRSQESLEELIKDTKNPSSHLAIVSDLSQLSNVHEFVDKGLEFLGGVDIVLHALGGGYGFIDSTLSWKQFELLHKINIYTGAEINRLVIPKMIDNHGGTIIHVGSIASQEAVGSVGYNTVKAALAAYVRSLGREMAASGIIVTGILPGSFTAPGNAMIRLQQNKPEIYNSIIKGKLPRNKMGNVAEVIPLICLLASDAGSMMSGCCVPIDAGEGRAYLTE
jgi:3-oxoacyl-[acyl-carrier protein] reductase